MQIIGAVINTSVAGIDTIFDTRDETALLDKARFMVDRGSQMLAINCGDRVETEPDDIEWAFRTIQREIEIPLCIDSPNPAAHKAGLTAHDDRFGRPLVDSITLEKARYEAILPLVREHHAKLVVLLHDEAGMPKTVEDRLRVMPLLERLVEEYGLAREDIYLDSVLYPVSVDNEAARTYLASMEAVRSAHPGYRYICGLNNISYGLPGEDLLDSAFVAMCAARGQEAVFIEVSRASGAMLAAIRCLQGRDDFCQNWLKLNRAGDLDVFCEGMVK